MDLGSAASAMNQFREEFREEHIPVGYLVTIRAYGTWLHGRPGSVDRFHNLYGTLKMPANKKRREYNSRRLAQPQVRLEQQARHDIELAIRETCDIRKWTLWAFTVRTNHMHAAVSATCKPEKIVAAFKANGTRKMREAGSWKSERSPWVENGGSTKYLWTEKELADAIAYVLYDQGEPISD